MGKIKTYNLFFIVFVVGLFFVASCANLQNKQKTNEDMESKQMCQSAGYEWMYMKPTQDGKFIKDAESCWGCMVEGIEHVCDKEKLKEFVETDSKENGMYTMVHNAMTAHAGTSDSVIVHMYKVGFVRPDAQPEKESLLTFTINEINSGKPVSNLEITHDKIMHVVLVRNDLKHFDHIHPGMAESGKFVVPYILSASGTYRIWIDFTIDGMQHIIDFDIDVLGNVDAEEKDTLKGIKVDLKLPKKIMAGEEVELKFNVTDNNGNAVPITEKFLGATAHLIEIDGTLEEFGHNHDEEFDNDNIISFKQKFIKSGKHKLWVQFSKDGETKTANFELIVS